MKRAMIFIDGSNLFHAAREYKIKIDYLKLINVLAANKDLIRAYLYAAEPIPPEPKQTNFYNMLRYEGISVKLVSLRKRNDIYVEKGVDVGLVLDAVSLAYKNAYDTMILVSGDDDFAGLVNHIKEQGKMVEVVAFSRSLGEQLKKTTDRLIILDKIVNQIELREGFIPVGQS